MRNLLSRRRGRLLTLVTCAELFHTDDRMVAFGHLVDRQLGELQGPAYGPVFIPLTKDRSTLSS